MAYNTILITDAGAIRTIALHRSERRNAMTPEMQNELISALEDTAASRCRVLVLTGSGGAFCSGLDLAALREARGAGEYRADAERTARLFLALRDLPVPTIAAVRGPAIAGGTGLAMLCDFTLAAPDARFGFTEVRIGFIPALVSIFLALQIGDKRSRDLLLTGRIFGADEALRLGLVNEIVSAEEMEKRIEELAGILIANSPRALSATKQLMGAGCRAWLDAAIAHAIEASVQARNTSDFREGIAAFLEKRPPAWTK
ncbi:MAG: enoyl-CoA hydratase/isomerase family protein [Terracidiphilus sp.]